ncbi:hypothetical protein N657DRAFT_292933 [Parathielavia appendiculata]|uniref:Uncharacterized protein n=1 Tax=Parathielavia appendiculata TaxID=2587402 RepID=A0AAN6U521_9PEZI|nr:hypothetical protein N657DRAFT_292933 [Parathielavia appendiculata]
MTTALRCLPSKTAVKSTSKTSEEPSQGRSGNSRSLRSTDTEHVQDPRLLRPTAPSAPASGGERRRKGAGPRLKTDSSVLCMAGSAGQGAGCGVHFRGHCREPRG